MSEKTMRPAGNEVNRGALLDEAGENLCFIVRFLLGSIP